MLTILMLMLLLMLMMLIMETIIFRRQLLFHDDEEETTIMRRHCALWNPHIGLYGAWDTQVLLVLMVLVLGLAYWHVWGLRHPGIIGIGIGIGVGIMASMGPGTLKYYWYHWYWGWGWHNGLYGTWDTQVGIIKNKQV